MGAPALLQIVRDLGAAPADLDTLLALVCERAVTLTGADGAVVELPDGPELVYAAAAGSLAGSEGLRVRIDGSLSGETLTLGVESVCADVEADPRVGRDLCRRLGIRSMLCIPLVHGPRRIGVLTLVAATPQAFDGQAAHDAAVLAILAEVISSRLDHLLAQEREQAAQAALAEVLTGQAALFDAIEEGLVLLDDAGQVVLFNQSAPRLLGLSRAQLSRAVRPPGGWEITDAEGGRLPLAQWPPVQALATSLAQRDILIGLHDPLRGQLWLRVTAIPVCTDSGRTTVAVSYRDVTYERRNLSALSANERLLRAAMDTSPVGMALTDLDGRMLRTNPSLARLLGRSAAELQGRLITDFIDEDDVEDNARLRDRLDRGAGSATAERRYVRADGSLVWVEATVSLLRDDDGEPFRYFVQLNDISHRRARQRELERQAETDPLTEALNRRGWDDALAGAVHAAAEGVPVVLAVLDLDRFKSYNDRLGHPAGDRLLRDCSALWRERLRGSDILARIGGEEFGILLRGIDVAQAAGTLVRLAADLPEGQTVSGGFTQLVPGEPSSSAVERADQALYQAKVAGRNRLFPAPVQP